MPTTKCIRSWETSSRTACLRFYRLNASAILRGTRWTVLRDAVPEICVTSAAGPAALGEAQPASITSMRRRPSVTACAPVPEGCSLPRLAILAINHHRNVTIGYVHITEARLVCATISWQILQ